MSHNQTSALDFHHENINKALLSLIYLDFCPNDLWELCMKKIGELMKDLGFNPDSSDSAKEAFLKYLIKNATGHNVQTPTEKKIIAENPQKIVPFPQQLQFDFDERNKQSDVKVHRAHKR